MAHNARSHALLFYHFVWSTKYRDPLIDSDLEPVLRHLFDAKAGELGITILEANGTSDHVHVLVRSRTDVSPAAIAKHLKGNSSHFINHVVFKNDPCRHFYWQNGFSVISISPQAVCSVGRYIRNQKQHHGEKTLNASLEATHEQVDETEENEED